jgi:hypothetical protein
LQYVEMARKGKRLISFRSSNYINPEAEHRTTHAERRRLQHQGRVTELQAPPPPTQFIILIEQVELGPPQIGDILILLPLGLGGCVQEGGEERQR